MYKLSEEQIKNAPDFMPVVGYQGHYEVGKEGSVWSLNYNHTRQRRQLKHRPDKDGYLLVNLWKDGKMKTRKVHQLVLDAYLPKPSDDLVVMHLNSTPADNRLENLSWGTCKENLNDPHAIALLTNHPDMSTPVVCVETDIVYPSCMEASRQTGIDNSSICKCLNGKQKTAGDFHWLRVKDC